MNLFVVFRVSDKSAMQAALELQAQTRALEFLKVDDGNAWLVSTHDTVSGLSRALGVTGNGATTGSAIIVSVGSYYGRADNGIWDWMKFQAERHG